MTKKRLSVAVHTTESFSDSCVNDAIQLAIAAFESAAAKEARGADAKSCAWQFIKYYYSAYFAANSLMRLCGYASTNLRASECTTINEQAAMYGVGGQVDRNKFAPGLYNLQFSGSRTPNVSLRLSNAKGGVHAQFWAAFQEFLTAITVDIKAGSAPPAERQMALDELTALTTALHDAGTSHGAWLSEIRNQVNYRFEHGMWFPYVDSIADGPVMLDAFQRGANGSTSIVGMTSGTPETVRAARCCAFLLAWLRDSMTVIGEVSRGRKKLLIHEGVLAFAARV